ncbi:hypothetical protein WJX81_004487 [Elliptochloris bilobata]|uniref:Metal-dependent protein hydrolase n=1 Tax=Elliptochloris bilobata TaxID=381761 RepID=A0AAW1S128_9CHLO
MGKRIGTHSGSFHCDEALGCYLLRRTKEFAGAEIVRSRDPEVLRDLDVVIDVGGVYDADSRRFDHHQRGFDETFGLGFSTKLSSAGLVYKHYGREVVASVMGLLPSHADTETVYLKLYRSFMEALDAIDNGINQFDVDQPPRYVSSTDLSSRVGALNPRWNGDASAAATDAGFAKAVELTGHEFEEAVDYYSKAWLPARGIVQAAIQQRLEVDSSGEIFRLDTYCPWKDHLYELEHELELPSPLKFCVYQDERERKWRVQAVSVSAGSFQNRRSLPAAWRGLRDAELLE